MIGFSEIKRCQNLQFTQIVEKIRFWTNIGPTHLPNDEEIRELVLKCRKEPNYRAPLPKENFENEEELEEKRKFDKQVNRAPSKDAPTKNAGAFGIAQPSARDFMPKIMQLEKFGLQGCFEGGVCNMYVSFRSLFSAVLQLRAYFAAFFVIYKFHQLLHCSKLKKWIFGSSLDFVRTLHNFISRRALVLEVGIF